MDISALLEEDVEDDMDLSDEEEVAALTEIKAAAVRAPSQKLFYDSNVSPAEHNAAVGICKAIREKKTHLIRQLVRYVGKPVCLEVLEETLKIEANGGVMRGDGKGRKEPGGVYIAQIEKRIAKEEMKAIRDACKPEEKRLKEEALKRKVAAAQKKKEGVKGAKGGAGRPPPQPHTQQRPRGERPMLSRRGGGAEGNHARRAEGKQSAVAYDVPRSQRASVSGGQLPRAATTEDVPDVRVAVVDYAAKLDYGLADARGFVGEEGECVY